MKTRMTIVGFILFAFVAIAVSPLAEGEVKKEKAESTEVTAKSADQDSTKVQESTVEPSLIVYYFHGTRRCVTCKKLEAYTQEAVDTAFVDELKSGALQWRSVNVDEDENKHFVDDYQLYTKTVILSRVKGGKEVEFKNLDKIWQLVRGEKEEYVKYIQDEVKAFLKES